jgi:hypothetical protein
MNWLCRFATSSRNLSKTLPSAWQFFPENSSLTAVCTSPWKVVISERYWWLQRVNSDFGHTCRKRAEGRSYHPIVGPSSRKLVRWGRIGAQTPTCPFLKAIPVHNPARSCRQSNVLTIYYSFPSKQSLTVESNSCRSFRSDCTSPAPEWFRILYHLAINHYCSDSSSFRLHADESLSTFCAQPTVLVSSDEIVVPFNKFCPKSHYNHVFPLNFSQDH